MWDLTSGEAVRKDEKLTEDQIDKLGSDSLRDASDEEVAEIIGLTLANYINSLDLQEVPEVDSSAATVALPDQGQEINEDELNDAIKVMGGIGVSEVPYVRELEKVFINQGSSRTALRDRILRRLTLSREGASKNWPMRLANTAFDQGFADGFVSPGAYEFQ